MSDNEKVKLPELDERYNLDCKIWLDAHKGSLTGHGIVPESENYRFQAECRERQLIDALIQLAARKAEVERLTWGLQESNLANKDLNELRERDITTIAILKSQESPADAWTIISEGCAMPDEGFEVIVTFTNSAMNHREKHTGTAVWDGERWWDELEERDLDHLNILAWRNFPNPYTPLASSEKP